MIVALLSAWRALRAAPWTTAAAVLTLALGAGASTSVFAVANGVLLRPLAYASANRLVLISTVRKIDGTDLGITLDRVPDWRSRLRATKDVAAYSTGEFTIRGVGDPVITQAGIVSREFFRVMGAQPRQGRWPSERLGTSEAVVSEAFATRWGAESPIGRQMTIGPMVFTVTAVAGAGFAFPSERAEIWLPMDAVPDVQIFGRSGRSIRLVARLVDGVSIDQARADASRVVAELFPNANAVEGSLRELREAIVGESRPIVFAFAAAAALLFLVACANAATLLVGRAVAREREFSVRLALGASRGQLIRSAFVESLLLATAATIAGVGLARVILATFRDVIGTQVPRIASVTIDLPVLAAAAGAAVLVTIICGTAPTVGAARGRELGAFRQGASTTHRAGRRLRDALVITQIAMAVVLLVGAGLLGRTVWTLFTTDIGADRDRALVARLSLTETTRFDASSRGDFVRRLLADVRALPGVDAAGLGSNLPPRVNQLEFTVRMINEERGQDETVGLSLVSVTPGYFEALGAQMLRGREFAETDEISGQPVAVMTDRFVKQLSPQSDPLDTVLNLALPRASGGRVKPRLVGIARDVRFRGLESPALGAIYVPWSQLPTGVSYLVVRSAGDPAALAPAITRVIRTLDPTMPVPRIQTLTEEVADAVEVRTLRLALVGGLAILAFVVAAGGLCGALVRDVVERRRELAIRGALGLTPRRLVASVLAGGAARATFGAALGLIVAVAMGRAMAAVLYGVSPYDVFTYVTVFAVVVSVALFASYIPARRASRINPVELLRAE